MLRVGLTGGIGAGKSTVSRRLALLGAVVLDADRIAREVVEPGTPGLTALVADFGPAILAPDGTLDRSALGALVFPDPAALARLNAIVHPLIGSRTAALTAEAERAQVGVLVHDVPLLVEGGLQSSYDLVVVVDASPQVQLDRLTRLRAMSETDARDRMARQATRADRLAVAGVVLANEGSPADLERQVDELWERLTHGDLAALADRSAG